MNWIRRFGPTCAALLIAAVAATPARAAFVAINQPTASYKANTLLFSFNAADFGVVSSVSNGLIINFDIPMVALTTPTTWTSWGSPPNTETVTPRVLWTDAFTSLTLTSSIPVLTLGFEAQPDSLSVASMTATFFNNNTQVGLVTHNVDGNGGAVLFAGTNDTPFNKVVLSSADDFAIAQIRASASTRIIAEPASFMQLASASVLGLAAWLVRHARGRTPPS
jgi:hypothetical protein